MCLIGSNQATKESGSLLDDIYVNSIRGAIDNGHMTASIKDEYKYPWRITLYPGLSCMFKCSFCGRNYDAVEKNADKSFDMFERIIEDDSSNDKNIFNISGGLEPLTSPFINNLFKKLYDYNYSSRMLTNGFMLSKKNIKKWNYINSLRYIRISLYGLDEKEYESQTVNKKAWHVVRNNIKFFNTIKEKTKLHLNFVLLPNNYTSLSKLVDYIDYVGGCDQVSLREDFYFTYEIIDREHLASHLLSFEGEMNKRGISVDFGYSLHQIKNGKMTKLLRVTSVDQLSTHQSPQIKVNIDPRGNIFNYCCAGFIDRPGADKHILGNLNNSSVEIELKKQKQISPDISDTQFMDAFNHLVEIYKWEYRKRRLLVA